MGPFHYPPKRTPAGAWRTGIAEDIYVLGNQNSKSSFLEYYKKPWPLLLPQCALVAPVAFRTESALSDYFFTSSENRAILHTLFTRKNR